MANQRIAQMTDELMHDIALIELEPELLDELPSVPEDLPEPPAEVVGEAYGIEIPSHSTPGKVYRYDATKLSSDRAKNLALLGLTCQRLAARDIPDSERDSAIRFCNAVLASF